MIDVSVTSDDLVDLAQAIKYEDNGKALRRDLVRNLRTAVRPAVTQAKASIMSMPSSGLHPRGESLRSAIARQVTTQVSLTSRSAKVKVKVGRRGMPRGFRNAPKTTQLAKGWRHPIYGRDRWVPQIGRPGWFDVPMRSHRAEYRAAVEAAVRECADRIARKV